MIRPATPDDFDALVAFTGASGLFSPEELDEVRGMMAAHFDGELGPDHRWDVYDDGGVTGVAYCAPEQLTDGVWNLYMLVIDPNRQGGGQGAALVRHVEQVLSAKGACLLLIETSGVDGFERTRTFYEKCGYVEEARIRDYFGPGDAKVVFWKSLIALSR